MGENEPINADGKQPPLQLVDLTLPTHAENLALDEALLDETEESGAASPSEYLRLWSPVTHAVILGRHSALSQEVNGDVCRALGIPVLRRCSGGATVMIGPGCLLYSVVLSYHAQPALRDLSAAHAFVLETLAKALATDAGRPRLRGTSDLAIGDKKISGNSLRCKRQAFLYHGTILHDFDLALMERVLRTPPRQPEYRRQRSHGDFVANCRFSEAELKRRIIAAWGAESLATWRMPVDRIERLLMEQYGNPVWTNQR